MKSLKTLSFVWKVKSVSFLTFLSEMREESLITLAAGWGVGPEVDDPEVGDGPVDLRPPHRHWKTLSKSQ